MKIFKMSIPEFAVNASDFKKLAHIYGDLMYYHIFLSISPKLLGGGGAPLATALEAKDELVSYRTYRTYSMLWVPLSILNFPYSGLMLPQSICPGR